MEPYFADTLPVLQEVLDFVVKQTAWARLNTSFSWPEDGFRVRFQG